MPPKHMAPAFLPPNGPSAMYSGVMGDLNGMQNGSRKRSYHEQAGSDMGDAGSFQYGNRIVKQPRRGNFGRGGRFDSFDNSRGGRLNQFSPQMQQPSPGFQNIPNMPNPLPGLPPLDPNNPMAAMVALQQLGFPIPGMPPNSFPLPSPTGQGAEYRPSNITRPYGQKLRCRDYDVKGFCARGNTCQFEHGSAIYVPPVDGMLGALDPANF